MAAMFDTLSVAKRLMNAGFSREQAEALTYELYAIEPPPKTQTAENCDTDGHPVYGEN